MILRSFMLAMTMMVPLAAAAASPNPVTNAASTGKKLSLQDVVDTTLKNHSDLGVSLLTLQNAKAAKVVARAPMLPQLNGTLNLIRGTSHSVLASTNFSAVGDLNSEQGTVTLSWAMDSGGNLYRYRRSIADMKGAYAGVASTANTLRLNVTTAYIESLRALRLLELAQSNQSIAEKQLEMVRARIKVGDAAPVDELPVVVQVRNAIVQVLIAQGTVRTTASALREAMGLDYGPKLDIEDLPEPKTADLGSLQTLLAEATRSRPDYLQARTSVLANLYSYRANKTASLPTLNLSYSNDQGYGGFSSLAARWQLRAFIAVPLWNWNSLKATADESLTQVRSSELTAMQLRKSISAQVEQAHVRLTNAHERIGASHVEVEAAQKNLEAQNAKYRLGAGVTVVDVVQAQVQLFQAQTNMVQAIYDFYSAQASLEYSVGQGVELKNYTRALDLRRVVNGREDNQKSDPGRKEKS